MKRRWKYIFGIITLGIIALVVVMNMRADLNAATIKVKAETIAKTFTEEGTVVSEQSQPIISTTPGKIIDLPVEEGDLVEKGTLVAVMDSKELQYQLEQLKGQLKSLKGEEKQTFEQQYASKIKQQKLQVNQTLENLKQLQTQLNRLKQLYQANAVSKTEYENAKHEVNAAENALKQQEELLSSLYKTKNESMQFYQGRKEAIQSQIHLVEHQIQKSQLVAPFEGIVSNLSVEKGMVVGPETPMMTIFKQTDYTIETYVLTEDVQHLKKGLQVIIVQDNEEKDIRFDGVVKKIAPTAIERQSALGLIEQRVKVSLKPNIPDDLQVAPGYSFDIEFTTAKQENQLVVPKTALFPYQKGDAVWVVRENKAKVQTVEKGFENDQDVAITKGLEAGDIVILNPQLEGLEEGKNIQPE